MKIATLISIILLTGCYTSSKIIPIRGLYPATPIIIKSQKTFDQAWDRLIDIFAQKGIAIRIIDRSSGLVVSNKTELRTSAENAEGKIMDSTAFVVVPRVVRYGKKVPITGTSSGAYAIDQIAFPAAGDWNVRIKSVEAGCTINVNINNLTYNYYDAYNKIYRDVSISDYRSTGVFEKALSDMINQ